MHLFDEGRSETQRLTHYASLFISFVFNLKMIVKTTISAVKVAVTVIAIEIVTAIVATVMMIRQMIKFHLLLYR